MDLDQKIIRWKEHEVELKPRGVLRYSYMIEEIYALDTAQDSIKEGEDCQSKILDADYSATDVDEFVKSLKHLNSKEQQLLKTTLDKHPELFSGGLGTLKIRPLKIELKPGAKPYHHQAYHIPKSLKAIPKNEVKRFKELEVLKRITTLNGLC